MEPLLKGPAGLEYLKKSFSSRYGSPDQAASSLPLTKRWLFSVRGEAEKEWDEHKDALSAVTNNNPGSSGLPSTTMRTGGNVPSVSKVNAPLSPFPGLVSIYQLTHLYSIFGKNPVQLNSNQVVNFTCRPQTLFPQIKWIYFILTRYQHCMWLLKGSKLCAHDISMNPALYSFVDLCAHAGDVLLQVLNCQSAKEKLWIFLFVLAS